MASDLLDQLQALLSSRDPASPPADPMPGGGSGRGDVDMDAATEAEFQSRLTSVLARMADLGYPVKILEQRRTAQRQADLYAQGRTAPGNIVTEKDGINTLSNHQSGLAADLGFTGDAKSWPVLGLVAKAYGLRWGGDWQSLVDRPHVELNPKQEPVPTQMPGLQEDLTPAAIARALAQGPSQRAAAPPPPVAAAPRPTPAAMPTPPPVSAAAPSGLRQRFPWKSAKVDPNAELDQAAASFGGTPVAGTEVQLPATSHDEVLDAVAGAMGGTPVTIDEGGLLPVGATDTPDYWTGKPWEAAAASMTQRQAEDPYLGLELLRHGAATMGKDLLTLPKTLLYDPMVGTGKRWVGNLEDAKRLWDKVMGTPGYQATDEEWNQLAQATQGINPAVAFGQATIIDPALAQLKRAQELPGGTAGQEGLRAMHVAGAMVPMVGPAVADASEQILAPESTPEQRAEGVGHLGAMAVIPEASEAWLRVAGEAGRRGGQAYRAGKNVASTIRHGYVPPLEDSALGVLQATKAKRMDAKAAAVTALDAVKSQVEATGTPVKDLPSFAAHLKQAMDDNRTQYQQIADAAHQAGAVVPLVPTARAVAAALDQMQQAGYEQPPSFKRAQATAERYAAEGSLSVADANQLLQDLNAGLTEFYNQFPRGRAALPRTDPTVLAMKAAAEQLRGDLYHSYDIVGGSRPAYELQQRYGQMAQTLGDVQRATNKAATQGVPIQGLPKDSALWPVLGEIIGQQFGRPGLGTAVGTAVSAGKAAYRGRAMRQIREANSINGLLRRAVEAHTGRATPIAWPPEGPSNIGGAPGSKPSATTRTGPGPAVDTYPEFRSERMLPPAGGTDLPPGGGGPPAAPGGGTPSGPLTVLATAEQIRSTLGVDPEELVARGYATKKGDLYELTPKGAGGYEARPIRTPPEVAGRVFYSGGSGVADTLAAHSVEGEPLGPESAARNSPVGPEPGGVVSTPPQGAHPLPAEQRLPPLRPGERPPTINQQDPALAHSYGEEGWEPVGGAPPPEPPEGGGGQAQAEGEPNLVDLLNNVAAERDARVAAGEQAPGPVVPVATLKPLSGKVAREALARVRTRLEPKVFAELVRAWRDSKGVKLTGDKWTKETQTEPMVNWLRTEEAAGHSESPEYQRVVQQARRAVEDGLPPDYFPPEPPAPPPVKPAKGPGKPPKGGPGGAGAPPAGAAPGGGPAAPKRGRAAREAAAAATAVETPAAPAEGDGLTASERLLKHSIAKTSADPTVLAHMRELAERQLGPEKWAAEQQKFEDEGGSPGSEGEVDHLWQALADHLGVSKAQAGQMLISGELGGQQVPLTGRQVPERAAPPLPARNPLSVVAKKLRLGDRALWDELTAGMTKTSTAYQIADLLDRAGNSKYHAKARELGARIIAEEEAARPAPKAPPKSKAAAAREPKPEPAPAPEPDVEDMVAKERLLTQIDDLDNALGHPFGDRDDFSALLNTDLEDLTMEDLQGALERLESVKAKRGAKQGKAAAPPKSKAAAARARPTVMEVDPARMEYGTGANDVGEGDIKAAYSADKIMEKGSKIRKPVEINGQLYTNTGGSNFSHGSSTEVADLYRLEPKESYKGPTHTYGTMPKSGFTYQGLEVNWKGQTYVLTDPIVVRGTPRTLAEATTFMDRVRKALSPEDQKAMDTDWAQSHRRPKEKNPLDPDIVHQAARLDDLASHPATLRTEVTPQWQRIYDAVEEAAGRPVSRRTLKVEAQVLHDSDGLQTRIVPRPDSAGYDIITSRGKAEVASEFGYDLEAAREQAKQLHEDSVASATIDAATKKAGLAAVIEEAKQLKQQSDAHTKKWQSLPMKDRAAYLKAHSMVAVQDRYNELAGSVRRVFGDNAVEQFRSESAPKAAPKSKAAAARAKAEAEAARQDRMDAEDADLKARYADKGKGKGAAPRELVADLPTVRTQQANRLHAIQAISDTLQEMSPDVPGVAAKVKKLQAEAAAHRAAYDTAWQNLATNYDAATSQAVRAIVEGKADLVQGSPEAMATLQRVREQLGDTTAPSTKAAAARRTPEGLSNQPTPEQMNKLHADQAEVNRKVAEQIKQAKQTKKGRAAREAKAAATAVEKKPFVPDDQSRQQTGRREGAAQQTVDISMATTPKGVKDALVSQVKAEAATRGEGGKGHVSFHVPGDGTFTAEATPQALGDMATRIEKQGADAFEGIVSKVRRPDPAAARTLSKPSSSPGPATFLDDVVAEMIHANPGITSADLVDKVMGQHDFTGHEGQVLQALRRVEAAAGHDVVYQKGGFHPESPVRLATLERDMLKLIPEKGLPGTELRKVLDAKFGKDNVTGKRRQAENALRRLARAQKIHATADAVWMRGPNPKGGAAPDYSYIQQEKKK